MIRAAGPLYIWAGLPYIWGGDDNTRSLSRAIGFCPGVVVKPAW